MAHHHTLSARPKELTKEQLAEHRRFGKTAAAAFLHSILWMECRSADFLIPVDWETVVPLLARMSPCDNFNPRRVLGALLHVDRIIPLADFGPDNRHTGMRTYELAFGSEGSKVMYLMRRERIDGELLTKNQIRDIERTMAWAGADVGHKIRHDAFTRGGFRTIEFRFWWE